MDEIIEGLQSLPTVGHVEHAVAWALDLIKVWQTAQTVPSPLTQCSGRHSGRLGLAQPAACLHWLPMQHGTCHQPVFMLAIISHHGRMLQSCMWQAWQPSSNVKLRYVQSRHFVVMVTDLVYATAQEWERLDSHHFATFRALAGEWHSACITWQRTQQSTVHQSSSIARIDARECITGSKQLSACVLLTEVLQRRSAPA